MHEFSLIGLDDSLEFSLQFDYKFVIAEDLHLEGVDGHAVLLVFLEAGLVLLLVGLVLLEEVVVGKKQFLQLAVQLHYVRLECQQLMDANLSQLSEAFFVVEEQLDPVFKLKHAFLKLLACSVPQCDFSGLHDDDPSIQQLVLLLVFF